MRKILSISTIFLFFCLLIGCGKTPSGILSVNKMAQVMADVHTAEAVIDGNSRTYQTDSAKRALMQSIFIKHGVTSEQVDTSFYWYGNHLEEYMKVYDLTIQTLEERIARAERAGAKSEDAPHQVSDDGDSVNIYRSVPSIRLTASAPSEFIPFHFMTDKNWDRGDRYVLAARSLYANSPMEMMLVVDYNDGSAEYVTSRESSDQTQRIVLVTDSNRVATSVYGYLRYRPSTSETVFIDSISVSRVRNHNDNKRMRELYPSVVTRSRF
ncbi:MAG: DUF4296 domain-containing protein [Duncaniella sp.]|nr:DUF4296 domain-containing protein [Duncaniella sp.]